MSGGLRESAYKEIIVIDPDGRTNLYSVGGLLALMHLLIYFRVLLFMHPEI